MKKVRIEYQHLGIFFKELDIEVPERWEDLNERQFCVCSEIYINPLSDAEFISRFFGIKKNVVEKISKFGQYKLTEMTTFVMKPTGRTNFFFVAEIPGTKLLSPLPKLQRVSIEHFALFDTYFFDYANNPTDENLCTFVAALYLKKGERITDIDFAERVNFIARKVDKMTLYATFLNYVFLRDWLSKAYPFVFSKSDPEDEKITGRKTKPAKSVRPDWNMMIDSIVGDDILNYDQYKEMACTLAFKTINKRIKEYKRNGGK